jgi:uncharacterized membrane protein YdbT with pleckstrin-like domain
VNDLWLRTVIWLVGLSAAALFFLYFILKILRTGRFWQFQRETHPIRYWRGLIAVSALFVLPFAGILAIVGAWLIRWLR